MDEVSTKHMEFVSVSVSVSEKVFEREEPGEFFPPVTCAVT